MAWSERKFEKVMKERIRKESGGDAEKYITRYESARNALVVDILPQIAQYGAAGITDHGPEHVGHVLDNAYQVLGLDAQDADYSAMDLYCLATAILFHDVGNIFGREEHAKRITEAYHHVRSTADADRNELRLISDIVAAHGGQSIDGNSDTMAAFSITPDGLFGQKVNTRDIAATLRFADELAEGKQRTSSFALKFLEIPEKSQIFHEYAACVDHLIDRGNQRIVLIYNIEIDDIDQDPSNDTKLCSLIDFIIHRIQKLNEERQYARHYSEWLSAFRSVEVTFHFIKPDGGRLCDHPLQRITDIVVPGSGAGSLVESFSDYDRSIILTALSAQLQDFKPIIPISGPVKPGVSGKIKKFFGGKS